LKLRKITLLLSICVIFFFINLIPVSANQISVIGAAKMKI